MFEVPYWSSFTKFQCMKTQKNKIIFFIDIKNQHIIFQNHMYNNKKKITHILSQYTSLSSAIIL